MTKLIRLLELAGVPAKGPTIVDATEKGGNINRKTADRILDPKGYFEKNKRKLGHKIMSEDGWSRANRAELSTDAAEAYAMDNFTPREFIDSEVFERDIGYDREEPITRDEILDALKVFLRDLINTHYMDGIESHEADLTDVAKTVYPQVRDVLDARGMAVSE